jgi:hypothetical protein
MSIEIPKMAIAFGQYGIPQTDVVECRVHLGCTKEVSSFDCYCKTGMANIVLAVLFRLLLAWMEA